MDLKLIRDTYSEDGVFGRLLNPSDETIAFTLEHSYLVDGQWTAKLSLGFHQCKRGTHHLHSGPIETFEILGVPGHTGILFHSGNYEKDSDGCVLLGSKRIDNMILQSRVAFSGFMELQVHVDTFTLEVCNAN